MARFDFSALPDTPLVSTRWLADHVDAEGLVILDATVRKVPGFHGAPAYVTAVDEFATAGHVPGARYADVIESLSDPEGEHPFTRPDARHFEQAVAALGIDNDTAVVVYDDEVGQWASRVWWLLRAFGHDGVRVLDGGLKKWRAEDRPLQTGRGPSPRAGIEFFAEDRPELWVDKDFIAGVLDGRNSATLVCGVTPEEFAGDAVGRPRAGSIPGSHNVPAARLVDPQTNAYLSPERLAEVFGPDVVASPDPIVTYCAASIAATSDALALTLLGRHDVVVYDGALNEWAADATLPLEIPALSAARSDG